MTTYYSGFFKMDVANVQKFGIELSRNGSFLTEAQVREELGQTPKQAKLGEPVPLDLPDGDSQSGYLFMNAKSKTLDVKVFAITSVDSSAFTANRDDQPMNIGPEALQRAFDELGDRKTALSNFLVGKAPHLKAEEATPRFGKRERRRRREELGSDGDESDDGQRGGGAITRRSSRCGSPIATRTVRSGADGTLSPGAALSGGKGPSGSPKGELTIIVDIGDGKKLNAVSMLEMEELGDVHGGSKAGDLDDTASRAGSDMSKSSKVVGAGGKKLKRGEALPCSYWIKKIPLAVVLKSDKSDRRDVRQAAAAVSRESGKSQANQDKDLGRLKAHLRNVDHAMNLCQSGAASCDDGNLWDALKAMERIKQPLPHTTLLGLLERYTGTLTKSILISGRQDDIAKLWAAVVPFGSEGASKAPFVVREPKMLILTTVFEPSDVICQFINTIVSGILVPLVTSTSTLGDEKGAILTRVCAAGLSALDLPEDAYIEEEYLTLTLNTTTLLKALATLMCPDIADDSFDGYEAL
eukprot:9503949-Pyramimonas_sp.AAC.1